MFFKLCNSSISKVVIAKKWHINIIDYTKYTIKKYNDVVIILFRKYGNIYHMVEGFNSLLTYFIENDRFPEVILFIDDNM